jgi:hypothetical protein
MVLCLDGNHPMSHEQLAHHCQHRSSLYNSAKLESNGNTGLELLMKRVWKSAAVLVLLGLTGCGGLSTEWPRRDSERRELL